MEKPKITKAVILSGGKGTRLAQVTGETPKSLVRIGDQSVLEHQISQLKNHGINEIYLMLGHLGDQIKEFAGDGSKWGVSIHCIQETEPLGTAGALAQLKDRIKEDFLVLSGDIMMNFNFNKFADHYCDKETSERVASFVVHPTDHPEDSDLVEVDEEETIKNLFRRPHSDKETLGNLSIASVFIFSPEIFRYISSGAKTDIEKDILPLILEKGKKVYAYNTSEYIKDVGTPERFKKAQLDYETGLIGNHKSKVYDA